MVTLKSARSFEVTVKWICPEGFLEWFVLISVLGGLIMMLLASSNPPDVVLYSAASALLLGAIKSRRPFRVWALRTAARRKTKRINRGG